MSKLNENDDKWDKVKAEDVGLVIYRGRGFTHREISKEMYFKLLGHELKDRKAGAIVFGEPTWIKVPGEFDGEGREIYKPFTVDGKYTTKVSNPNDDHEIACGIVGFNLSKDGLRYFNPLSKDKEPKVEEEIFVKPRQGDPVKPDFLGREFEHFERHKDSKGRNQYEGIRITEIRRLSIDGKKGELHLTLTVKEGLPVNHEVKLHDISPASVESLIINWKFLAEADKLLIAADRSVKPIPLKESLQPISNEKFRSVKVLSKDDKFLIGEYTGINKDLQKIEAGRSGINWIHSGFSGTQLLKHGTTATTTFLPLEDGHVIDGDPLRYGTTVSGCVPMYDILVENPDGGSLKRAYMEYDTSYLASFLPTLDVKKVRFNCERAITGSTAVRFGGLNPRPTSYPCPDATYALYTNIDGGTGYITRSLSATGWITISMDPPPPAPTIITPVACRELEALVGAPSGNWFAIGIKKDQEGVGLNYRATIKGQEYDAAANPKPTIEVTFTY
jgi:hypothetical protein